MGNAGSIQLQEQKMAGETLNKEDRDTNFTNKEYHILWNILDREDRAKLLFICELPYKQRKAITLLDNGGFSAKEATSILGYCDTRQFQRVREKAIKRVLTILNSKKHNKTYSDIYKQR